MHSSMVNGDSGFSKMASDYDEWLKYLDSLLDDEKKPSNRCPGIEYFLIRENDDKLIGEIPFFIEDANQIYWIYSKIILIFGTIFPIELFGKFIQKLLKYSPVFVTTYGPAKLFVHFNYIDFIKLFGFQILYIEVIYFIALKIYKKGVRKLNVNGG